MAASAVRRKPAAGPAQCQKDAPTVEEMSAQKRKKEEEERCPAGRPSPPRSPCPAVMSATLKGYLRTRTGTTRSDGAWLLEPGPWSVGRPGVAAPGRFDRKAIHPAATRTRHAVICHLPQAEAAITSAAVSPRPRDRLCSEREGLSALGERGATLLPEPNPRLARSRRRGAEVRRDPPLRGVKDVRLDASAGQCCLPCCVP